MNDVEALQQQEQSTTRTTSLTPMVALPLETLSGSGARPPKVHQDDVETASLWGNVVGAVSYNSIQLGLYEAMTLDEDDFEGEPRFSLSIDPIIKHLTDPFVVSKVDEHDQRLRRRPQFGPARQDVTIKPGGKLGLTLTFSPKKPTPSKNGASLKLDDGSLRQSLIIFSIQWKTLIAKRERAASDFASHQRINSTSRIQKTFFSAKALCCLSIISVSPSQYNFGECSVGEYYTADFAISNLSDLPALVIPNVNSDTLGLIQRDVLIPPREQRKLQVDYVARLVNYEYKRAIVLYNVYNPDSSSRIEIKAKNVDPNQILSHSIFYKIFTRNNRRQLQIYYDRAFYNMPNVRSFSIKNIFHEPLKIKLRSIDRYEVSIFTLGSKALSRQSSNYEGFDQRLEDLKWGGVPIFFKRTASYDASMFGRRSTSSLTEDEILAPAPSVETSTASAVKSFPLTSSIEDCIAEFERPGFPFEMSLEERVVKAAVNAGKKELRDETVQRIRLVQKTFKDFAESRYDGDHLVPVDDRECTLAVGGVYEFIVIFEPRSHGTAIYRVSITVHLELMYAFVCRGKERARPTHALQEH